MFRLSGTDRGSSVPPAALQIAVKQQSDKISILRQLSGGVGNNKEKRFDNKYWGQVRRLAPIFIVE